MEDLKNWFEEVEEAAGKLLPGWKLLESDRTNLAKLWKYWEESTKMNKNAKKCIDLLTFSILIKLVDAKTMAITTGTRKEKEKYRKRAAKLFESAKTPQKSRNNGAEWLEGIKKGKRDDHSAKIIKTLKKRIKKQGKTVNGYSWGSKKQIWGGTKKEIKRITKKNYYHFYKLLTEYLNSKQIRTLETLTEIKDEEAEKRRKEKEERQKKELSELTPFEASLYLRKIEMVRAFGFGYDLAKYIREVFGIELKRGLGGKPLNPDTGKISEYMTKIETEELGKKFI